MPAQTRYHLTLLDLGEPLRVYATSLQPDPNASALLVHQALSAAFSGAPDPRGAIALETSLQQDIARRFGHETALRA